MSTHKHIDRICVVIIVLCLIATVLFMNGESLGLQAASRSLGYEDTLFDTSRVHTIDIEIDDWDGFIETCESEEYAPCSVVIDNEAVKNVAIRGKGNTSLSTVKTMGSERYSFKIEFDQYENGKNYHGLDKLSLNNIIQDNTYMKDYLTYRMMDAFGVDSPLCSFVYITVNGEDWGLYLAVEGVEDSFLQRNYGRDAGELYKPDSMSFGGGGPGNGKDFNMDDFLNRDSESDETESGTSLPEGFDASQLPEPGEGGSGMSLPEGFDASQLPTSGDGESGFDASGKMPGGFSFDFNGVFGGMGSEDVKLKYIDDDPDSYRNIFDNAKTDVSAADQSRLIESLKKLSAQEDLESVVDVDEVIRFFVVHNFVCNGDSYTGSIVHNYYLHESGGQLSMIPWDYNLAFGTFQGANATSIVNDPIDSPMSVSSAEDRPMWGWILSDETYTEQYHESFAEFLDTVDVVGMIDEAYELISSYVEKDSTAFCTYEEFETGVKTLRTFCTLRTESVRAQLDGTLASTETEQSADDSALVDASAITLSDMGSMGGGGFGGRPGGNNAQPGQDNTKSAQNNTQPGQNGGMSVPDGMELPEDFDPSQFGQSGGMSGFPGGQQGQNGGMTPPDGMELPEDFDPSQFGQSGGQSGFPGGQQGQNGGMTPPDGMELPEDFDSSQFGRSGGQSAFPGQPGDAQSGQNGTENGNAQGMPEQPSGGRPSGSFGPAGADESAVTGTSWILLGVSVGVLLIGLLFAIRWKRH